MWSSLFTVDGKPATPSLRKSPTHKTADACSSTKQQTRIRPVDYVPVSAPLDLGNWAVGALKIRSVTLTRGCDTFEEEYLGTAPMSITVLL